ncbi:MAG TPA: hypothetical protein VL048_21270 [Xanthobacteraceae bacterium]|jgi:hypothetical protein|nr:hypothetical protein [Xanthobacteraceae bacterium]
MGDCMRLMSFVKIAMLAGVVALPSFASAKAMKAPPGSCTVDKKHFVAANTVCSFNCNPQTKWCSQQLCVNGTFTAMLPCYTGFCTPNCGG